MARKLTQLTEVAAGDIGENALFYLVDPDRTSGDRSVGMTDDQVAALVGSSPTSTNPIENEYVDNAAMFADQGNQTTAFFQYVTGTDNYYEKLSTNTASISDYRLLSDTEIIVLRGRGDYNVVRLSDIQDDATPITSINGGRIGIEYDNGTDAVTGVFFNELLTDAITDLVALGTGNNLVLYNQDTGKYHVAEITAYSTVNVDYTLATLAAGMDRTEFSTNDRIRVLFDLGGTGGGGGAEPVDKTGTNIVHTEDAYYNKTTPLTTGALTLDDTAAVQGVGCITFIDRYTPTITSSSEYRITGEFSSTKFHEMLSVWNGDRFSVYVTQFTYLATPVIAFTPSSGQLELSFGVLNATSYTVLFNTVDDEGSASAVPSYNGTDTTYTHTGLSNGTTYYYFISAFADGFFDSDTGTGNSQPEAPNTAIGGMGLTYPTAADLATFLGITAGDISNYNVDGSNNITCDINANYTLPTVAFNGNTDITYYRDSAGRMTGAAGTNHFTGATNLIYLDILGNAPVVANGAVPNLVSANVPNNTGLLLIRSANLSWMNVDSATFGASQFLFGLTGIESLLLPSLTNINYSQAIEGYTTNKIIIEAPLATTANSSRWFYQNTNSNNLLLFDGMTTFGASQILRDFAGELYIPNVSTNIGGVATDSATFLNCASTTKIYAHNNLATNNGGGVDGDLAYVTSRGGTVVFITNTTPPSAVSDLAATNITATTVDITFSTPATTNTIIGYDVYVKRGNGADYRLLNRIVNSGDTVNNLISGNITDIKIKTVDEFRNRSGFSNEIQFTTL